jgi:hypothetical protein
MDVPSEKQPRTRVSEPKGYKHSGMTYYQPEMNVLVLELARKGKSWAQIARAVADQFDCAISSFYKWRQHGGEYEIKELTAIEAECYDLMKAYWDDVLDNHIIEEHMGPKLNTRAYVQMRSVRFREKETKSFEHSGADGSSIPVETSIVLVSASNVGQDSDS